MIEEIKNRILAGGEITPAEAVELSKVTDRESLYAAADEIRRALCGNKLDTCSIVNARSGKCPENCKWCSQSAHHQNRSRDISYSPRRRSYENGPGP